MTSRKSTIAIFSLIFLSCFSGSVVGNDAGSGGDAGGGHQTAVWLHDLNATYYGNLSVSANDTNDYYGINMSIGKGIAAGLTSPVGADFDLILYDHTNSTLDGSYNGSSSNSTSYDSVSSNGTNTSGSGNTVYLRVQRWSGSGTYTLQIWTFAVSTSGGGNSSGGGNPGGGGNSSLNQNDANTGGDASDLQSNATPLNSTDASYYGYVHEYADEYDWYSIAMPAYHAISAQVSWTNTSANIHLELFDQNGNTLDYGSNSNPVFANSTNHTIGNTTVTLSIRASSGETGYTLSLQFSNIASAPVYNQNDAGTGGDASNNYSSPTPLPVSVSGVNGTGGTHFTGWHSEVGDQDDYYSVYVPPDYGIAIDLTSNGSEVLSWILLINSSSGGYIGWSTNQHAEQNTHSNGTDVGGQNVTLWILTYNGEGYYNFTVWLFSLDADGDGWNDASENSCGTNPNDSNSVPLDTDGDGICNSLDDDDDGDGYSDSNDSFPLDVSEWSDIDFDGIGDNADTDDDGDGWTDAEEHSCGTSHNDSTSIPSDFDGDWICDSQDVDIDGDGYENHNDSFDFDPNEWYDTDSDGTGDNADFDDDGDGFDDSIEIACDSNPLSWNVTPLDSDSDNVCDAEDEDDDNDGIPDSHDQFPLDANEWADTDGDGLGNNADYDDDGDGTPDLSDAFPLDASEQYDLDGDGIGRNADDDDDNDGWSDSDEQSCGTDQWSSVSLPDDYDNDGVCNQIDTDDDNDGTPDTDDPFPLDENEWEDNDGDGVGDIADEDDDNDGWSDLEEPNCGTDPGDPDSIPDDFDGDGVCDLVDSDDDNDLVIDIDDDFPYDSSESRDTDGDGVGNNADTDDDDDNWSDNFEEICQTDPLSILSIPLDTDGDGSCDLVDEDDDNDGWDDEDDEFPFDSSRWAQSDDGLPMIAIASALAFAAGAVFVLISRSRP